MSDREPTRVVLDTNVLVDAARSRRGASFALLSLIPSPDFVPCLSIGLYSEWQAVLTRAENIPAGLTEADALAFVRYLAGQSHLQEIHFLWRPFLPDPDDDMVLELAFSASCQHIITHNVGDYHGSETFGVAPITPGEFLNRIRNRP